MSLFNRKKSTKAGDQNALAEITLKAIHDGVVMTDRSGVIQFINPAAITMLECGSADKAIGLDYGLLIRLESKEGRELSESENPLIQAMNTGQALEPYQACIIAGSSGKRIPVSISVLPVEGLSQNRVITFRDITKELEEEGEQTEFISTASHEMRTPVATIDGYLSLTLNPQTATIDERARGYLTAAQNASKHLGKLFQDLLDVTKLDDGKIRPRFVPVEMVDLVKTISDDYVMRAQEAGLSYNFGSDQPISLGESRHMQQVVYGFIDVDFMREILDNLIENAIKYTPSGGSIYVNVRGDGDRVLINVTDSGIGISADDLTHIFQKFYRVDNSDTRTIGGNGLGLYLVKQRAEAMGGRVWAESAFGEGSTFFVSLPRITSDEYEKRMIMVHNQQMQAQMNAAQTAPQAPMQMQAQMNAAQTAPQAPMQFQMQPQAPAQPPVQSQPQPLTQDSVQIRAPAQPQTSAAPVATTAPNVPPPAPPSPQAANPPMVQDNNNNNNINGELK